MVSKLPSSNGRASAPLSTVSTDPPARGLAANRARSRFAMCGSGSVSTSSVTASG